MIAPAATRNDRTEPCPAPYLPLTPAPAGDRRFSLGLSFVVARPIADAGFPPITSSGNLVALQQALHRFTYASPAQRTPHQPGCAAGYLDGTANRMAAAHHPQEIERIEREADAGRDLLEGAGPIPAGIDAEVGAAIRRISQHFAEHGCRW